MRHYNKIAAVFFITLLAGCSLSKPGPVANDITARAIGLKDPTLCTSIDDSKTRSYCQDMTANSAIIDRATTNADAGLCAQITDLEYKKACELAATSAARKKEVDLKESTALLQIQQGTSIEACNTLTDRMRKNQCIMNVASAQAVLKRDATLCNAIEDSAIQKICKSSVR